MSNAYQEYCKAVNQDLGVDFTDRKEFAWLKVEKALQQKEQQFALADEIMHEELLVVQYGQECPQYPQKQSTSFPKAEGNKFAFDEEYERIDRFDCSMIFYNEYFRQRLSDVLERCEYYVVKKYQKDWTVKVYERYKFAGYRSVSVFIHKHPFTTTREIDMLKLTIKSFLSTKNLLKTDDYNDDFEGEVIFNGV